MRKWELVKWREFCGELWRNFISFHFQVRCRIKASAFVCGTSSAGHPRPAVAARLSKAGNAFPDPVFPCRLWRQRGLPGPQAWGERPGPKTPNTCDCSIALAQALLCGIVWAKSALLWGVFCSKVMWWSWEAVHMNVGLSVCLSVLHPRHNPASVPSV